MNSTSTTTDAHREKVRADALADIEQLDAAMRERGLVTPEFERFITEIHLLISVHVDPAKALDLVLSIICGERVAVRS